MNEQHMSEKPQKLDVFAALPTAPRPCNYFFCHTQSVISFYKIGYKHINCSLKTDDHRHMCFVYILFEYFKQEGSHLLSGP